MWNIQLLLIRPTLPRTASRELASVLSFCSFYSHLQQVLPSRRKIDSTRYSLRWLLSTMSTYCDCSVGTFCWHRVCQTLGRGYTNNRCYGQMILMTPKIISLMSLFLFSFLRLVISLVYINMTYFALYYVYMCFVCCVYASQLTFCTDSMKQDHACT